MLPQQRAAWFQLAVFALALTAALVLVVLDRSEVAWAALGILGLWGLSPAVLRISRDAGEAFIDERDRVIARRAGRWAFGGSYLAVVLTCIGLWSYYHFVAPDASIPTGLLTAPVWVAFATVVGFRAIAILILYSGSGGWSDGGK